MWLSIDDFGTGHSSLGRLREYEFDELKIDRSFVGDLDTGDPTLVATQIAMAHGLGLGVVAEGVETAAQLEYLRNAGCGQVQGYFISCPLAGARDPGAARRSGRVDRCQDRDDRGTSDPIGPAASGRAPEHCRLGRVSDGGDDRCGSRIRVERGYIDATRMSRLPGVTRSTVVDCAFAGDEQFAVLAGS